MHNSKNRTTSKGSILCEQAYAQGKMLDHSDWYGELPRNITPSDIDAVIDCDGRILLVEFSTHSNSWTELKSKAFGQWKLYANLVRIGRGAIVASLAIIEPHPNKQINTVHDIKSCQFMFFRNRTIRESILISGDNWKNAVKDCLHITT